MRSPNRGLELLREELADDVEDGLAEAVERSSPVEQPVTRHSRLGAAV